MLRETNSFLFYYYDIHLDLIKKSFLLCVLLITFFSLANARNSRLQFGLQSCINSNNAFGNDVSKTASVLSGFNVGGQIKIKGRTHLRLKIDLAYNQFGWTYRSVTFTDNTSSTGLSKADVLYELNNLNLPLLAEDAAGNKIQYYFDGGIFTSILLNNKIITKFEPNNMGTGKVITSKSEHSNRANFGVAVGAGIQTPVTSKLTLTVGCRNLRGLTQVYKTHLASINGSKTNWFAVADELAFTV